MARMFRWWFFGISFSEAVGGMKIVEAGELTEKIRIEELVGSEGLLPFKFNIQRGTLAAEVRN